MQTPEQRVQNKIEKYFKSLQDKGVPLFFEKRQAGGFTYRKGLPDMYIVLYGKHIEIEIKAKGGKTSTMQELWQRRFKEIYRIPCYVVDDEKQVEKIIESMKKDLE